MSRCEWESPPPDKYGEECSCRAGPIKKKTGGGLLFAVVALVLGSFNSVDEGKKAIRPSPLAAQVAKRA